MLPTVKSSVSPTASGIGRTNPTPQSALLSATICGFFCKKNKFLIYLNMKKRCTCDICNRRAYLLSGMYHIDSKCINSISANIISINPRNEDFPLVVVHEQPPNHRANPILPQSTLKSIKIVKKLTMQSIDILLKLSVFT